MTMNQRSNSIKMKLIHILQDQSIQKLVPITVMLVDSILKIVYDNAITKSVTHKKNVVVKHFSGAKMEGLKYFVKPMQEKQTAQIIIHVGTNDCWYNGTGLQKFRRDSQRNCRIRKFNQDKRK